MRQAPGARLDAGQTLQGSRRSNSSRIATSGYFSDRRKVVIDALSLKPDLWHTNRYGGTLLSTIPHGPENNLDHKDCDQIGCLELALKKGAALPKRTIELADDPNIA